LPVLAFPRVSIWRLPAKPRLERLAIRGATRRPQKPARRRRLHGAPVLRVDRQLEDPAVGELLVADNVEGNLVLARARESVAKVARRATAYS
jgi:hypothetical protein